MAKDAPDGVNLVAVSVVVSNEPVTPQPTTETLVLEVDRLTTTSTDYLTVVTHTATADTVFILTAVEMESTDYDHTKFQLAIAGSNVFTDLQVENPYSPPIPALKLVAGTVVTLSCKSADGTSITVDGDIIGKEIG